MIVYQKKWSIIMKRISIDDLTGFADICECEKLLSANGTGCWTPTELTRLKIQKEMRDQDTYQKRAEGALGLAISKS